MYGRAGVPVKSGASPLMYRQSCKTLISLNGCTDCRSRDFLSCTGSSSEPALIHCEALQTPGISLYGCIEMIVNTCHLHIHAMGMEAAPKRCLFWSDTLAALQHMLFELHVLRTTRTGNLSTGQEKRRISMVALQTQQRLELG